jgi:hypothetical protein
MTDPTHPVQEEAAFWRGQNPQILAVFAALKMHDLEPRLSEALPWLAWRYPGLDWEWLRGDLEYLATAEAE